MRARLNSLGRQTSTNKLVKMLITIVLDLADDVLGKALGTLFVRCRGRSSGIGFGSCG